MRVFYSLTEAAEIVGLRYDTVWRLARSGRIPARRFGRTWRVPRDAFGISGQQPPETRAAPMECEVLEVQSAGLSEKASR